MDFQISGLLAKIADEVEVLITLDTSQNNVIVWVNV